MKLSEAKREFKVRCCHWWHGELKNEINSSFPNLRLFKTGYGWQLHHFMQKLELSNQLTLANALVKTYLGASGGVMTAEEQRLWDEFDQFLRVYSGQSRRETEEKVKFASKRALRKAAVSKFVEAFGPQCFDMKLGEEWDPLFQMRCCGWIVSTQLTFGRSRPVLECRHTIESETRITHPQNPEITGPAMTLSLGVGWIVNQWDGIANDEVEAACTALIKQVGFFLEAAPKLLKGLEFEKIMADSQ